MKENVNSAIQELIDILEKSKLVDLKQKLVATFICNELEEIHLREDIRNSIRFKTLFDNLYTMKGPVLYWFKIRSTNTAKEIFDTLNKYKGLHSGRVVPALRKNCPPDSEYLYVGKVKRYFWGRIVQHLGYAKDPRTQGLQLFYWAKNLNLEVELYAIEFDKDMADLLGVLETLMAREFKPIVGSHSN